jgi:uncharacterized protein (DUF983 family)
MSLKNQVSVQCPFCHHDILFYRVKPRFNCPQCATTLGSNRSSVDVWAVLIYIALGTASWLALRELGLTEATVTVEWAVAAGVFAIATYCLLAPRALHLEPDTWSRDQPAAPAGRKRKILSYRQNSDPGAAGQKRVS